MSKYSISFVLMFVVSFINIQSHADILGYDDMVKDSINYSIGLRIKTEDIRISYAQYRENLAGMFPSVNFVARAERYENIDRHNGTTFDSIGNEIVGGNQSAWKTSTYVMGQYYISHWYKKIFEVAYYKKMNDASLYNCEAETKKIIKEVTELYGMLAEAKMKLKYANAILERLEQMLKIKKTAFEQGQYSYEDILKAESDVTNMEKEVAKIRKEVSEYFLNLSLYTGRAYQEDIEIEQLLSVGHLQINEENNVIEQSPEYKARIKEMDAISYRDKAALFNFIPDISLYGRYDLYNSSPDNLGKAFEDFRPVSYSVGLVISMPLFDGGAKYWAKKRTAHELRKQEESIRATYEEKNKTLKTLNTTYESLSRQSQHYIKITDQYRKMLEISEKAFQLGERSKIDMLELEKDALAMERDLKITEHSMAIYEKQYALEQDYNKFMRNYDGNRACKY